jgi:hypothetical protein
VTVLRDPAQRAVSLYSYARYGNGHYLANVAHRMTFEQFVTSGVTCTVDNAQVRQLSGFDRFEMENGVQTPYHDMTTPFGEVTREHLEAAKANLSSFSCVGVASEFDAFLGQMRQSFAWRIPMFRNQNVTRRRYKPAPSDLDICRERNILDYELFEYAKGLARKESERE